jgi:Tol biopolymer transport system component
MGPVPRRSRTGPGSTAIRPGPPDDSKILFSSTSLEGNTSVADIFVISPDGTGETRITDTPDPETGPIWSPDGAKIGYNVEKSGDPKTYIYVIDAAGTGPVEVPGTGRFGNYFSWQALPGT